MGLKPAGARIQTVRVLVPHPSACPGGTSPAHTDRLRARRGSGASLDRWESFCQGTHGTGKTGKMDKKNPCQGKHREFGNFAQTQGKHREFVCSSCNFPDSQGKGYCEFPLFFQKQDESVESFCVCNSHKLCKLA